MSDFGSAEKLRDPEDLCTCGHLAMNHYIRAGRYVECGWCGRTPSQRGYVDICPRFTPSGTDPGPTTDPVVDSLLDIPEA